jgi:hypothetical protein
MLSPNEFKLLVALGAGFFMGYLFTHYIIEQIHKKAGKIIVDEIYKNYLKAIELANREIRKLKCELQEKENELCRIQKEKTEQRP